MTRTSLWSYGRPPPDEMKMSKEGSLGNKVQQGLKLRSSSQPWACQVPVSLESEIEWRGGADLGDPEKAARNKPRQRP